MGFLDDIGNSISNSSNDLYNFSRNNPLEAGVAGGLYPQLGSILGGNYIYNSIANRPGNGFNQDDIRNQIANETTQFFNDPRMQSFNPFVKQGQDALSSYGKELSNNPIDELSNYTQNYKNSPQYTQLMSKMPTDNPLMGNFTQNALMKNASNNANELMGFRNQNLGNLGGMYNLGSRAAQDYLNSAIEKANAEGQRYINQGNLTSQEKMQQYNQGQGFGGLLGTLGGVLGGLL